MIVLAHSLDEARRGTGEIQAAGTDVLARRRTGVSRGDIVDINRVDGLRDVDLREDGATVGALLTVHEVAEHEGLKERYSGFAKAAESLATPQIRRMASLGGALLQRTRCWYYRHPAFNCYKNGGDDCYARGGQNPNGVVFDLGACVYPHPATLGMALLAYEARVKVNGESRPIDALYDPSDPTSDHTLQPGEILTHVQLPAPVPNEQTAYFRSISRADAEWPLVECLVRLVVEEGVIAFARVGVGGVASVPLRLENVERALLGQSAANETLAEAAKLASDGASPLAQTEWKVTLLERTVLETLERATVAE